MNNHITVYTDGSCDVSHKTGGWSAILFIEGEKTILEGYAHDTTHQRMELVAVIKSIEWIHQHILHTKDIVIYSDSQYAVNIGLRRNKLLGTGFRTRSGNLIKNADLVRTLMSYSEYPNIRLVKVRAHRRQQLAGTDFNREVDKLSRKMMRKSRP